MKCYCGSTKWRQVQHRSASDHNVGSSKHPDGDYWWVAVCESCGRSEISYGGGVEMSGINIEDRNAQDVRPFLEGGRARREENRLEAERKVQEIMEIMNVEG